MKFNKLQLILPFLTWVLAAGLCPGRAAAQNLPPAQPAGPTNVTGAIAGTVLLPPQQVRKRAFRGDAYRNRLAPDRSGKTAAPATRSPYDDVVVSAHPAAPSSKLLVSVDAVRMDQQTAQFRPRVLPVTVGTRVEFVNKDRFYHNVFSLSRPNEFDIGRKPTGVVADQVFEAAGLVEVFCDIHPQMSATILVLDTPWFTQPDSTGVFQLQGLPYGTYQVRVYHPEHDVMTRAVEVGDGVAMAQNFTFGR